MNLIRRFFERLADLDDRYPPAAFYGLLFAYVAALLAEAMRYDPRARLFPLLVGVPLAVALAVAVFAALVDAPDLGVAGPFEGLVSAVETHRRVDGGDTPRRYRREAETILWLLAFVSAIRLLGFFPAIPCYVTAAVYRWERDVRRALLLGLLTTAALYVLFAELLSATVYRGALAGVS